MSMCCVLVVLAALSPISGTAISAGQPVADSSAVVLTMEDAVRIALSENASVRVADIEIEKSGYAKKGAYGALMPQINGSASYQRTIKKQVMYMDFDMSGLLASIPGLSQVEETGSSNDGIEVGRWNTYSAGITASLPLINAQLWESLRISDTNVELAVEKARGSRLETVAQVKQAYYTCLLAKEVFNVYRSVYENALDNYEQIRQKFEVQKASELELSRAQTTLANAIPDVYDAESSIILALWQLKSVMGINLATNIDVAGNLENYAAEMLELVPAEGFPLEDNSTLRQLALQAETIQRTIRMQQNAYIPTLSLAFSYSFNAMTNDFKFSEYRWNPYSFVGLTLSIPIFSGGQRYHTIRQTRAQYRELQIQEENTRKQLQIAISQYLTSMETAVKRYAAAGTAVESAQKAFGIVQESYDVGRSTLTDLNDAQVALTRSELSVCQAVFNYLTAKSNLEKTLGTDLIEN